MEPDPDEIFALAFGRILRLCQRPTQPGDVEEYERCRDLIMKHCAPSDPALPCQPNYARDRNKGAAGD